MNASPLRGWVCYDGQCRHCRRLAQLFRSTLRRRHFELVTLQTQGIRERLGVTPEELLAEMRVLRSDGGVVGGADALVYLAGYIWWARPLRFLVQVPGVMPLLRWSYRQLARRRYCAGGFCEPSRLDVWIRSNGRRQRSRHGARSWFEMP